MNREQRPLSKQTIKVLQVSAELFPWLKTGGLADVAGALPRALAPYGVEMRALVPGFSAFVNTLTSRETVSSAWTPWGDFFRIDRAWSMGDKPICLYVIVAPALYERAGTPYEAENRYPFSDNHKRFGCLSWAAKLLAEGVDPDWQPSVVHAHDWHAGLTPLYLRYHRQAHAAPIPSLLTIHNLAYQGLFDAKHREELVIPDACWHLDGVEFHGQISMLKAGIVYADHINTVSPSYAREIQGPEQGCGLEGLLKLRAEHLSGILNGIDQEVWDPSTDPYLSARYGRYSLGFKRQNHRALESELGLQPQGHGPRCAVISRLSSQKGLGLIVEAAHSLIEAGSQLLVLGSGDSSLEHAFRALESRFSGRMHFRNEFDEGLAHRIFAGSDVILIPSMFEPCGLTQMYGMRYGCLPLVHRVGGLADTVRPWSADLPMHHDQNLTANGFGFAVHRLSDFLACWSDMMKCWQDKQAWQTLQSQAMSADWGWGHAASLYARLYQNLLEVLPSPGDA